MEGFPVMLQVVRVKLLVGGALPHSGPGAGHSEGQQAADTGGPGGVAPVPTLLTMASHHIGDKNMLNKPTFASSLSIIS